MLKIKTFINKYYIEYNIHTNYEQKYLKNIKNNYFILPYDKLTKKCF